MKKKYNTQESLQRESKHNSLGRREFIKLTGAGAGGLYVFFLAGSSCNLMNSKPDQRELPNDFNAFLRIDEDGTVTCLTGKVEMGQGIIASLAQMMADELSVPFDKVKMIMGDTDQCPYDAGTWGSLSVRAFGPAMLAAAAEAKSVLAILGAEHLKTTADSLELRNGMITVKGEVGRNISYGALVKGKKVEKFLDPKPSPKDFSSYELMGKTVIRTDTLSKVKGEALYAGDFRIPGMLYAKILRPPSHGASRTSVDTSEAKKVPEALVIEDNDLIAVLHKDPEQTTIALQKIKAEYSFNEKKVDDKTIFDYLLNSEPKERVIEDKGSLKAARKKADKIVESTFTNSYVAHSPIETHCALAYEEGDKLVCIVSTQSPFGTQEMISEELGIPLEKVRIITPLIGGGFGGKAPAQQALEAARLTKLSGKPVMAHWTREEEFFYDTFRPAAVVKITSAADKNGKILLWDFHEYYAGSRGSDTIYDVPDQRIVSYSSGQAHPFGTGAWRAPGNNTNTFARESQIDIMASAIGMDPLEFRLKNLADEKMKGVLKAVAGLFGWTPAKSPGGRGYGIACGIDAGTYVAHMAEVKVDRETGRVQVVRVACAQDMGFCVNPDGAKSQMEGCIMMGLGYALTEEVEFTGGNIKTSNYGTYKIPLFSWMPKIETMVLDKKEPMQGGGEPAIICMGGVIANAIFDATGVRLFNLPMKPEKIKEAIYKG